MTAKVLAYHGPTHNSAGQQTVNYAQHMEALSLYRTNAHGRAIRAMLEAWEAYRNAYHAAYDEPSNSKEQNEMDAVIGRYWAEVGFAIKRLLDGETGGLDCGSLAHNITAMIEAEGFTTDGYSIQE